MKEFVAVISYVTGLVVLTVGCGPAAGCGAWLVTLPFILALDNTQESDK